MLVCLVYVINLACIVRCQWGWDTNPIQTVDTVIHDIEEDFVDAHILMREIVCPNHEASCANITTTYADTRMNESTTTTADKHCCVCSCSDECLVLGNCCRDKLIFIPEDGAELASEQDETCVKTTWASPSNKAFAALRGAYLLVKMCPDAYKNQYVASQCTQSTNFQSLTDLTPVYDKVRGLNYANIYCAICHKASFTSTLDHNIDGNTPLSILPLQTSWYTELECVNARLSDSEILHNINRSRDILDKVASEGFNDCFIRWRPNNPATTCFQEDLVISTCLDIHKNVHIPKVVNLCHTQERNLYKSHGNVYTNFFCFLCNTKYVGDIICTDVLIYNQDSLFYLDLIPLTLLIDFTRVDEKALGGTRLHFESDDNCEHQTFNLQQDGCLQWKCPPRTELVDGHCIPVLKQVKGAFLEFMLMLRYKVGDNIAWTLTDTDVTSDATSVVTGNQPSEVHLCWSDTIEDKTSTPSSPTFIFHGSFNYPTSIDIKETFERVNLLIGIFNSLERLHVDLLDSDLQPLALNAFSHFTFRRNLRDFCGSDSIAMSNRQFCKAILLKQGVFAYSTNDSVIVGSVIFAPHEYVVRYDSDYMYIQICLDTYTQKMGQADTQSLTFNETLTTGNVTLTTNNKLVFPVAVSIVTFACTVSSMVSLLLLIITYMILKFYRSTPTLNTLMLSIHLLIAQCLFQFGILQIETSWLCEMIGIATHYFWLVYMCWTCVCTFQVFHRFVVATMRTVTDSVRKTLTKAMLFSYTCPVAFVVGNIVYSRMTYNTLGYGPDMCYISTPTMIGVTFALPIGILVGVNFLLFLILLVKLVRVKSEVAARFPNRNQGIEQLKVYFRINTLTGSTWMFAFLYVWTKVRWLEYVFIVLNASNGVLIMLSFMINDRIFTQLKLVFNQRSTKVTKQTS